MSFSPRSFATVAGFAIDPSSPAVGGRQLVAVVRQVEMLVVVLDAEALLEAHESLPKLLVLRGEGADHLRCRVGKVRVIERGVETRALRHDDARRDADDRGARR